MFNVVFMYGLHFCFVMVSALDSGASVPGSGPGQGHCCVLRQDTLISQCLSPPRCINGYC